MKRLSIVILVVTMALMGACVAVPLATPGGPAASGPAMDEDEHTVGLPEQLGEVHFAVSCTPEAQTEFNHGVALLHSFWYAAAIASFNTVAELDPSCAMAHWGVAMSLMEPLWAPPTGQVLVNGWATVEKAAAAGTKTAREQAYINAVIAFYKDAETVDHRTRALAYEQVMAQLVQNHPEDIEAQIFYALALNATALPTDKTYANQRKAIEILEPIAVVQTNHPGVTHYLIHSNDYPALAAAGLDAARRYAEIAPSAPHALHMPSHIFTRLGYWQESIDTNMASALSDPTDPFHALDYMMYGYLQLGKDEAAQGLLDEIQTFEKVNPVFATAYALAAMPARYVVERGQWDEAAALTLYPLTLAWENFPQAEALLVFARGLGAARAGDVAAAQEDLDRLQALREAMVATNQGYWAEQANIQSEEIAAWIALAEGDHDEALATMRRAAELEAATEKHPVTPGPIVSAQKLLGDMLLELDQPEEALAAFEASHLVEPNRFHGLYGAARAAELAGDMEKAHGYYTQLATLAETADGDRAELAAAKAFLAQ